MGAQGYNCEKQRVLLSKFRLSCDPLPPEVANVKNISVNQKKLEKKDKT